MRPSDALGVLGLAGLGVMEPLQHRPRVSSVGFSTRSWLPKVWSHFSTSRRTHKPPSQTNVEGADISLGEDLQVRALMDPANQMAPHELRRTGTYLQ